MGFFSKLFGGGASVNYKELLEKGAQIIDVRTPGEYAAGHIKKSVNIPLQTLNNNLSKIKKDRPVICCCASGARSGQAKSLLAAKGYEVYNGGGWSSLNSKI